MFYVYVLKSEKTRRMPVRARTSSTVYTVTTLANRKPPSTGIPWILIHSESFRTRAEAVQKEIYYKTGRGRDELNAIESSGRRGDRSQVQILSPRYPVYSTSMFLISILCSSPHPTLALRERRTRRRPVRATIFLDCGLSRHPRRRGERLDRTRRLQVAVATALCRRVSRLNIKSKQMISP